MSNFAKEIIPVNLEDEMKQSYLDYAMSVIIGRALPDVRDGLKPVHRRVLFAMSEEGNDWNKSYKKSARTVGSTMAKYHPHGDMAIYDTMVRMAQPFSMRYVLIDGQGNFGCFTGDTKIKLLDGTEKSFAQLAQLPKDEIFYVYSFDRINGKIVRGEGHYSRITRPNAELIELTLKNGKKIRCTPDHQFLIRDGNITKYVQAQNITLNCDELMPHYHNGNAKEEGLFEEDEYYHHIIDRQVLTEREDVYDIEVNEHHNFLLSAGVFVHNSVDGDPPAAQRYTEVRLAKIAHELLTDLDKDTVDFQPNYDDSEFEPKVLPTRVPLLLVNGSSGIAVGMATNIPPHNLREVINASLALCDNAEIEIDELMTHIPGPDFPTAGIINGATGIYHAYTTGRGKIYCRARCHFEEFGEHGRQAIIVTELPYQVNKARLLEKIAELIKEAKLEGISGLRDESDKDGMRMVIELKRGEMPDVVLNNLYKQTYCQTVFGMNMVAIVDGRPYCLTLKEILNAFIDHRRVCVTRRTLYLLRKARDRAHILEGLAVALANINAMIELIKAAANPAEAKAQLLSTTWQVGALIADLLNANDAARSRPDELEAHFGLFNGFYRLSETQTQAILELRLHRLTGLEQDKIIAEYGQLLSQIDDYLDILKHDSRLMTVIREELIVIRDQYGDNRRTEINQSYADLSDEDLITEEDMVVTMSHQGYVKAQPLTEYKAQKRGGRGKSATATKEEDFVDKLIIANTHDTILCFSSLGKVYGLKVYQLPIGSRGSRGKPFVNVLQLEQGELINALLPIKAFSEEQYIFMATANGTVKKTSLKEFERQPANGKIAINLRDSDQLVGVAVTNGTQAILLFSSSGKAVCFNETDVRGAGRTAAGMRGMRLKDDQKVIALITASEGSVLNITENGYGKRTKLAEFPCHARGGQGVIAIKTSARNGSVVGAVLVNDNDEIMLITDGGTLVRTRVAEISIVGRNAQGVTIIRLDKGEKVVGVDRIEGLADEEENESITDNESAIEETIIENPEVEN